MKHEYEINKALKETGVTLDRLKRAFHDGSTMLVSNFMWHLAKHVHGEAVPAVLSQLRSKEGPLGKQASLPETGDPKLNKVLADTGFSLQEAKELAYDYHIGSGKMRKSYILLFSKMCRSMTAAVSEDLTRSWAKQIDDMRVVTASSKWVSKNCKMS